MLLISLEQSGACSSAENQEGLVKEEETQELHGKVSKCFMKIINKKHI